MHFIQKKPCFFSLQKVRTGIKALTSNCEKKKVKRKEKSENTRNKILELVADKIDKLSLTVRRRLINCSGLPTVEARYRIACQKKLDISSIISRLDLPEGNQRMLFR